MKEFFLDGRAAVIRILIPITDQGGTKLTSAPAFLRFPN